LGHAQVVEQLPSKLKALSLTPSTAKEKQKTQNLKKAEIGEAFPLSGEFCT
jgi:hypothetical protein